VLALQRSAGNAAAARFVTVARQAEQAAGQEDDPAVQRSSVHEVLRSAGRPLDPPVRAEMEARLGADFSGVRVHTGDAAARSAEDVGARAYTSGDHVVLGPGGADRHTLAHELTHVIQQRFGPVAGTDNGSGLSVSDPGDRFEREAEANARTAMRGPAPEAPAARHAVNTGGDAGGGAASVQRMMPSPAGQASQQAAQPPPASTPGIGLDGSLGREIPGYWNDLTWTDEGDGLFSAFLPQHHAVFQAIGQYVQDSQNIAPYTSAAGERTRMEAVRTDLADPAAAGLDAAGVARLNARLREGQEGGPPPPRSRAMNIVQIKVYANKTLWQKYITNREMYHQSLVKEGPQGFMPTGEDRSDKIDWTTGARPTLGGTAATADVPGFERPDRALGRPAPDAGEAFLFHGTSPDIMDLVARGGYRPDLSANKGTPDRPRYGPLGQGVYNADSSSKAQTYERCSVCHDYDCTDPTHPPHQMMLNRALVGSPKHAHLYNSRRSEGHETLPEGRTSVYSRGLKQHPLMLGATGTNEFLIKDKSLLYPEIRIYYRT
jgi:hypothetical protein